MLLDEPLRAVKLINRQDSSGFSAPHQIRPVADDAYKYRDEFDEWPVSNNLVSWDDQGDWGDYDA